jgi:hypothetical protein
MLTAIPTEVRYTPQLLQALATELYVPMTQLEYEALLRQLNYEHMRTASGPNAELTQHQYMRLCYLRVLCTKQR